MNPVDFGMLLLSFRTLPDPKGDQNEALRTVNHYPDDLHAISSTGKNLWVPKKLLADYFHKALEAIPATHIVETPSGLTQFTTDGIGLFIRTEAWTLYADAKDLGRFNGLV